MHSRLRLWFGLTRPVDRRAYLVNGAGLMFVKYGLDAALIGWFAGRFWSPLDYFTPLWTVRQDVLRGGPTWLGPALVLAALPFLWIGVSMTMRRAMDAGRSPWLALVFFLPVANYALMLALSVAPTRSVASRGAAMPISPPDQRLTSAVLGVAAAVAVTVPSVLLAVYLKRTYSAGLFLGLPFTIGYISAHLYNRGAWRTVGETAAVALAGVTVAAGAMIVFALEGLVCVGMALPLAWLVALPGAFLGRAVALRTGDGGAGPGWAALLLPMALLAEPRATPTARDVVTVVEIDALPAAVWRRVVTFPELAAPREWMFRAGLAAPLGARVEGHGVGAVRYCDFTTGSFVEPVTAWDEPRRLAFDIADQPPPLRELNPFGTVRAPHLDGYFTAVAGAFLLEGLPGGRTRLTGTTRYEVDMYPETYWALFASVIIEAIHVRVLRHIAALAEGTATRE
jgi:uncharacterized membrane protein YhaH (DUF805 family)